jgi:hypothetical protein
MQSILVSTILIKERKKERKRERESRIEKELKISIRN